MAGFPRAVIVGENHGSDHVPFTLQKQVPRLQASFLNRLFFFWGGSIVWLGWRRPLTLDDLWDVEPENTTASLAAQWDAAFSR